MDPHLRTNLERKVLSKAFNPKHNDISHKEDFPTFSLSQKLRQSVTQGSQGELSRGFSISQSFQQIFLNTKDYDFSGISTDLDEDLALRLRDLVAASAPMTRIALPGRKLVVQELTFRVPVTIGGTAGTVIEVSTGPLEVDFSGYIDPTPDTFEKATFCELALFFPAKPQQPGPRPQLFTLKSPGSRLELRDCFLTSNAYKRHITEETPSVAYCIDGVTGVSVAIRSCNVLGFTQVVEIDSNSTLFIEKCHLEECQSDFLSAHSPKSVLVEESVFERGHGSGLKVNFAPTGRRGTSGTYTSAGKEQKDKGKEIRMEACEIRHIDGCGVQIWSESSYPLDLSILLNHNRVSECKAEAVSLKHISLKSLQIASNDMSCNQGSGLWLQKVRSTGEESVLLSFNRAFDSYAGYGIYLYDAFAVLDNNECFRNNCKD